MSQSYFTLMRAQRVPATRREQVRHNRHHPSRKPTQALFILFCQQSYTHLCPSNLTCPTSRPFASLRKSQPITHGPFTNTHSHKTCPADRYTVVAAAATTEGPREADEADAATLAADRHTTPRLPRASANALRRKTFSTWGDTWTSRSR